MLPSPEQAARQLREIDRARCERSLLEFFTAAWPVFDPDRLSLNWHHAIIAEHLEAVTRGEIRHLVIMVPPRCSKTGLVNIAWPLWTWVQSESTPLAGPQVRFMCLSYGSRLAHIIATTARKLVMSEWYQGFWGDRVKLSADQQAIEHFSNEAGGARIASWMGAVMGLGAAIRICDDPLSREEAWSDIERERVLQFYDESLATRETDPKTSAEVIIMQRLHQQDIAGHIFDRFPGRHTTVCLPMEYEAKRSFVSRLRETTWPEDPRRSEGELLWPSHIPREKVEQYKATLGPVAYAGQYQQSPVSRGGNIIQQEWWKCWPDDAEGLADLRVAYVCPACRWSDYATSEYETISCPACGVTARQVWPFPEFSYRLLTVDTAYGEEEGRSYSAATGWGVWHGKDGNGRAMLTDAWRGRVRLRGDPKASDAKLRRGLVETIYDIATRRKIDLILIEKKSRGVDLHNELERMTKEWPFALAYSDPAAGHASGGGVSKRAKAIRLEAVQPLFVNGLVWAPNLAYAQSVIEETVTFPNSASDDLLDCSTSALKHLRDHGHLQSEAEWRREQIAAMTWRGRSGGVDIAESYGVS